MALLLMLVLTGVLIIGLAIPMILRRVPPNGFYGMCVPATLEERRTFHS